MEHGFSHFTTSTNDWKLKAESWLPLTITEWRPFAFLFWEIQSSLPTSDNHQTKTDS